MEVVHLDHQAYLAKHACKQENHFLVEDTLGTAKEETMAASDNDSDRFEKLQQHSSATS